MSKVKNIPALEELTFLQEKQTIDHTTNDVISTSDPCSENRQARIRMAGVGRWDPVLDERVKGGLQGREYPRRGGRELCRCLEDGVPGRGNGRCVKALRQGQGWMLERQ